MKPFKIIKSILFLSFYLVSIYGFSQTCPPYAQYTFSGNANDSSGNGLHGNVVGASLTNDQAGTLNSAYDFDGLGDRINLPSDFDFPQRTWCLWFKADKITTTTKVIFDSDHNGIQNSQTQVSVREMAGVDMLRLHVGNPIYQVNLPINTDVWYHVTIAVDNGYTRFYLNGSLVGTATNTVNSHSQQGNSTVSLGVDRFHSGHYFDGVIDQVTIFDCALTEEEVLDCYTDCINGAFHLINPNDGSGKISAFDQSTLNSNKTLVSRTWTIETIETDRIYYPGSSLFQHLLPKSDHYLICLETIAIDKTTGECCKDRHCEWVYIEVEETSCSLDPSFSYHCFTDDCIFQFSGNQGSSNRNIRSWFWTFGDGTTGIGQKPVHTYSAPGQYEICLTIAGENGTDGDCCTETTCRTINFNCKGISYQEICDQQQQGSGQDEPIGLIHNPEKPEVSEVPSGKSISHVKLAPNPAEDSTELSFSLSNDDENVSLILVEAASGVQTVLKAGIKMSKGQHRISIDCRALTPGIYVLLLQTAKESKSLRMVHL